jgi:lysozyme family protein
LPHKVSNKSSYTIDYKIKDTIMAEFAPVFEKTLKFEGGYQAMPSDTANYNSQGQLVGTNKGISAVAYEAYFRKTPSVDDIKNVTTEMAEAIYKKNYWDKIRGDDIKSQDVADIIFALYIGNPSKSNRIVEESLNDLGKSAGSVNSPFSDTVVKAINSSNDQTLFNTIKSKQLNFVAGFSSTIRQGWINKISSYEFGGSKKKWVLISIIIVALAAGCYYGYKKGYHKQIVKYFKK